MVAEGASADDAIRIVKDELPDIVLLDVSMPGGGIEAARTISRVCPVVKIIMLTVSESEEHVAQALAAGARGYVLKGTSGPELINTMRAVSRGEYYVTPGLGGAPADASPSAAEGRAAQDGDLPELTKREEQILDHVARGMTNKEIAKSLSISEKTVKHYMTNIMQKLRVRNRVEAVLVFRKKAVVRHDEAASAGGAPTAAQQADASAAARRGRMALPRCQRCRTKALSARAANSTIASRTKIARPACALRADREDARRSTRQELARQLPRALSSGSPSSPRAAERPSAPPAIAAPRQQGEQRSREATLDAIPA